MFGPWIRDDATLERLRHAFSSARPFPHIVIDGFLEEGLARRCCRAFPPPPSASAPVNDSVADDKKNDPFAWHVYCNPIEVKLANDRPETWDRALADVIGPRGLQSDAFLDVLRRMTGVQDLENDPHMHGAGLHCHPVGGKLDMHLDYGIHPISGKERRLNLILYLNEGWREEYGGDLQLWSQDALFPSPSKKSSENNADNAEDNADAVRHVYPIFNRAVLFRTSDDSWHGMPDPLRCPEHEARKSLAIYYVTDPRPGLSEHGAARPKARFVGRPGDPPDEALDRLRELRRYRRLTPEDLTSTTSHHRLAAWSPPEPTARLLRQPRASRTHTPHARTDGEHGKHVNDGEE